MTIASAQRLPKAGGPAKSGSLASKMRRCAPAPASQLKILRSMPQCLLAFLDYCWAGRGGLLPASLSVSHCFHVWVL
jgi:hypothetical protein